MLVATKALRLGPSPKLGAGHLRAASAGGAATAQALAFPTKTVHVFESMGSAQVWG